jgi:hypothetical protein
MVFPTLVPNKEVAHHSAGVAQAAAPGALLLDPTKLAHSQKTPGPSYSDRRVILRALGSFAADPITLRLPPDA